MKKIISFVGLFAVMGAGVGDAHGVAMSAQVRRLLQQKQEKIEQLEKCEGKKQGWMIAGISTIGLTAVGVGVNIAQASKSNRLSDEIEMEKSTLERHQNELNRIQNDIAAEHAKQAKSGVGNGQGGASVSVPTGGGSSYDCVYFTADEKNIDYNSDRVLSYYDGWVWCGDGGPYDSAGCEDGKVLLQSDDSLMQCDNSNGKWKKITDNEVPRCEGKDIEWYQTNECIQLFAGHDKHISACLPTLPGNSDSRRGKICWSSFMDTDTYRRLDNDCTDSGGIFGDYACGCLDAQGLKSTDDGLLCECIDDNKHFDKDSGECVKGTTATPSGGMGDGNVVSNEQGTERKIGGPCVEEDMKKLYVSK